MPILMLFSFRLEFFNRNQLMALVTAGTIEIRAAEMKSERTVLMMTDLEKIAGIEEETIDIGIEVEVERGRMRIK